MLQESTRTRRAWKEAVHAQRRACTRAEEGMHVRGEGWGGSRVGAGKG